MAADDLRQYFYVTHNGWVKGAYFQYPNREVLPDPPEGTIETWERRTYTRSVYRLEETITWSRLWKSPDISDEKRAAIRLQIGKPDLDFPDETLEARC
jgi:hypothetical protein